MGVTARMLGGAHTLVLVLALANIASAQNNGDEAPFFECPEPNGKFRDQEQCDLFYICRKEVATIEYCPEGLLFDDSIPNPLIFDVKVGSCVRKEQASDLARLCDGEVFNEVDGFSCPGGDVVGPQNLLQAHPIHAHPTDCRY